MANKTAVVNLSNEFLLDKQSYISKLTTKLKSTALSDEKLLLLVFNKDFFLKDNYLKYAKEMIDFLSRNKIKSKNVCFTIREASFKYNKKEWEKLVEVEKYFNAFGVKFGFEDMENLFTLKQVEKANFEITNTANKINASKLSPIEKILQAYLIVTSRKYLGEDEGEHFSTSRSVYSILNGEKIVCVGFSEWFKAIIDQMHLENIKVYSNHVLVKHEDGTSGGHQNNVLYIKDEKYGLDGFYYFDATWDCGNINNAELFLEHFLVPVKDIKNLTENVVNRQFFHLFSVGGDKIEIDSDFFKDIENNVELKEKVFNHYYKMKSNELKNTFENCNKDVNKLKFIYELIKENDIQKVNIEFFKRMKDEIEDVVDSENYENFVKNIKEIKSNFYPPQYYIDYEVETFIEKFSDRYNEESLQKLYSKQDEKREKYEFILSNKDFIIEKIKQAYKNDKELPKYAPILKEANVTMKYRAYNFIDNFILAEIDKNVPLEEIDFNKMIREFYHGKDVKLNDERFDALDYVNNKITSMFNMERDCLNQYEELEKEYSHYQNNIDEFYLNIDMHNEAEMAMKDYILNTSEPISIDKLYLMLTNVMKYNNKDLNDREIFNIVKTIINFNTKNEYLFHKKSSSNVFHGIKDFAGESEK